MRSLAILLSVLAPLTLVGCSAEPDATSGGQGGLGGDGGAGAVGGSGGSNTGGSSGGTGGLLLGGQGGAAPCPTLTTCQEQGANCGPISDGCEGVLDCGTCVAPESCGGSGVPSVCGVPPCTPITCDDQGIACGPAGDGCGNVLDCGSCVAPETCGGGGPGQCGGMPCVPQTCADQGVACGPAGDGCGNLLSCGSCAAPETCGGGGVPGECGAMACVPLSCASFGPKACGPLGDGCGGLLQCGGCLAPETCGGGGTPSQCGTDCTNLCLQQVACAQPGVTTTISGTVYAPNGVDPLPNVLVYVPNAPVQPFPSTVTCDNCSAGVSGEPLVSAATDAAGQFVLKNVPVGANIPLVIQTGRWRRQVTLSNVVACQNNAAPPSLTRLPKNKAEGDIPRMAFATGAVDVLECLLRKVGVADSEFTSSAGNGRIHLYVGDGKVNIPGPGGGMYNVGGANAGPNTASESVLVGSLANLQKYDMVLFPCKGAEKQRTNPELANLVAYANSGGRVFATHFSHVWLANNGAFANTANWNPNQCSNAGPACPADQNGLIDTSFPKGQLLADWLQTIGASSSYGQIPLTDLKHDFDGVVPPSQAWVNINNPALTVHYTFNTPVNAPSDQQCGRVLFDDFHVENHGFINQGSAYGMTFPAECEPGPMTAQEKLLEFMLFDLGSCVAPEVPSCTPVSCAQQNIECGPAGDGCGNLVQCGSCPQGQTCGGGGMPSQCGAPMCAPQSCAQQNIECGPAGDGCGNVIQCGSCVAPETCGGGGVPGQCGAGVCNPVTCAQQNIECGPAGDGCGAIIQCGPCVAPDTCGGGGVPGQCGSNCTPNTCISLGFDCGYAADGCGDLLDCGVCSPPQTCGGGGTPNVCGGFIPN